MTAKLRGDHRYITVYFPEEMIDEIRAECERTGRSLNWIIRRAWVLAKRRVRTLERQ